MVFEYCSISLLGTVECQELHVDMLFRGKGYRTRTIDWLIVPAIISISKQTIYLDIALAYEDKENFARNQEEYLHTNERTPLSERRISILERLAKEVVTRPTIISKLRGLVEMPKEIGKDQRFPKYIRQIGYRSLLLERIKSNGKYGYSHLKVHVYPSELNHLKTNGATERSQERNSGRIGKGTWR